MKSATTVTITPKARVWLGRHQAFGMIANRCSAADAECLKQIRDSGHYKKLGLTWAKFCEERAGIGRVYGTDHLEESAPIISGCRK